jgi:hypothetical protein
MSLLLVQVFFDGPRRRPPWLVGLLLVYVLINAALLQPTLAYLTILFLGVLRPPTSCPAGVARLTSTPADRGPHRPPRYGHAPDDRP